MPVPSQDKWTGCVRKDIRRERRRSKNRDQEWLAQVVERLSQIWPVSDLVIGFPSVFPTCPWSRIWSPHCSWCCLISISMKINYFLHGHDGMNEETVKQLWWCSVTLETKCCVIECHLLFILQFFTHARQHEKKKSIATVPNDRFYIISQPLHLALYCQHLNNVNIVIFGLLVNVLSN